jgi:hypothetical protein
MFEIYIASHLQNAKHIREEIVPKLEAVGIKVRARWLLQEKEMDFDNPDGERAEMKAKMDLQDMDDTGVLVLYDPIGYEGKGMWVELGYALCLSEFSDCQVHTVTHKRTTVFQFLPEVLWHRDWDEFIKWFIGAHVVGDNHETDDTAALPAWKGDSPDVAEPE